MKRAFESFESKAVKNGTINISSKYNHGISGNKSNDKFIDFDLENENNKKFNNNFNENEVDNNNLSDYELNELSYEEALIYDKRNLFQLYLSKIKRENIIIFTFLSCDDYNLFNIKLSRFLFLMASDMTFNAFFSLMIQCINYI